jgi:hypothetical protein
MRSDEPNAADWLALVIHPLLSKYVTALLKRRSQVGNTPAAYSSDPRPNIGADTSYPPRSVFTLWSLPPRNVSWGVKVAGG